MNIMAKKPVFTLSANIESGLAEGSRYIVTPNVEKVMNEIVNAYQTGIHSFTVIGTYGTGKSSFLLNVEKDLDKSTREKSLLKNPGVLHKGDFEILNILGDSKSLSDLLSEKLCTLGSADCDPLVMLKNYYSLLKKQNKMLFIAIDEFGKVLEHAAKHNPEEELYFFQKFTEFVNAPSRNILLLTTLHQNFSAYAGSLKPEEKNEWTKVKGRFQEVVFAEPVEQLLFLAAEHLSSCMTWNVSDHSFRSIHQLAVDRKFVDRSYSFDIASKLYPLDTFSAYTITKAIQRYGQNERSLFSFLNARGSHSLMEFTPGENLTYNLAEAYDYIVNSFHSFLTDANSDSMGWSSIRLSIERVEGYDWKESQSLLDAIKMVKAIGMVNLFGNGGFSMTFDDLAEYASKAMAMESPHSILQELSRLKIVRFAEYRSRVILFEGTDVNIEEEILKSAMVVPKPVNFVDELRVYFNERVSPVKAYYYHRGTPRYFKYELRSEAEDVIPTGDVDGYVQMIFSTSERYFSELLTFSKECDHAIIFAFFTNTEEIVEHLWNIQKYRYIIDKVLVDKSDRVAMKELLQLLDFEKALLNKTVRDSLFSYTENVVWIYKGEERNVSSHRDFNRLLSFVCDDVYSLTPTVNNELFNKHKLSSSISAAKAKYLQALLENSEKEDLGFDPNRFPPEKTIYFSLLKNTGLHRNGTFADKPANADIKTLWDACEEFLRTTTEKPRKLSELVKILSSQPYKIKDGFLDFWLPTYLFMKRQDYSLYGSNGQYIPVFNLELLDLMKKHLGEFRIKAYAVEGVKLELFNQYRKFLNLDNSTAVKGTTFIDTIKPYLFFYNRQLNDYAKHTMKLDHRETIRFREVLAKAKDPEKAFLEDLPMALGYDEEKRCDPQEVGKYFSAIQRAVRELRACYGMLIDRIEEHLVLSLGLSSGEYVEYVAELQQRIGKAKQHRLTPRQKEFFQHAMTCFDNRVEWYQSICYAVLDSPLERMRDEQEQKLLDDLVFLFRECEKEAVLSESLNYQIDEGEEEKSLALEEKITAMLSGDENLDVFTLVRILQKRINK